MTLELFRLRGKVRGVSLKRHNRIVLGLMFATAGDIRNPPDIARFCDLCGEHAITFCQRHSRFLCGECVGVHQQAIARASLTMAPGRCCYVSMAAYREIAPLGTFAPIGEPNPIRDGWNEVR